MEANKENEKPTTGSCLSFFTGVRSGILEASGTNRACWGEPLEPPPGEMADGQHWLGLMWLLLAFEMLWPRGTVSCDHVLEVMPDVFFHREHREVKKVEREAKECAKGDATAVGTKLDWYFFKEIFY